MLHNPYYEYYGDDTTEPVRLTTLEEGEEF